MSLSSSPLLNERRVFDAKPAAEAFGIALCVEALVAVGIFVSIGVIVLRTF